MSRAGDINVAHKQEKQKENPLFHNFVRICGMLNMPCVRQEDDEHSMTTRDFDEKEKMKTAQYGDVMER